MGKDNKKEWLQIRIRTSDKELIKNAARLENKPISKYIMHLVNADLRQKKLK